MEKRLITFCALLAALVLPALSRGEDAIPLPGEMAPEMGLGALGGLKFRGYAENTLTTEYLREERREIILNGSRVRLNLSGKPSPMLDFEMGVVGVAYSGARDISLAWYMPDSLLGPDVSTGTPGTADFMGYNLEDEFFIQEAFGTFRGSLLSLRVGRQKFYTGTGFAYNPIDLFNFKDPLDPTYENDGFDSMLLTFDLPRNIQAQALVRYAQRLSECGYLGRIRSSIGGWDAAIQYTDVIEERVDWETINTTEGLSALAQGTEFGSFRRDFRWRLAGIEAAGEVGGIGLNAEGGYVFGEAKRDPGSLGYVAKDHGRFLVGLDHTFHNQLYLLAEYLYLGQGRNCKSAITLSDRMAYYSGDIEAIVRDTLFLGASYPMTETIEFAPYGIIALNETSVILNPWITLDAGHGAKVWLSLFIPVGSQAGQNGRAASGGFLRTKFSF